MKAKPYIGVTGPVIPEEVKEVCDGFSDAGYSMDSDHIPMIGFLVNYKTLNGKHVENKRYPSVDRIPELLEASNGQALTMIHYNSREMKTLSNQVSKIFDSIYQDGLCQFIQLNISWPDTNEVAKIKKNFPDMKIVFQASRGVLSLGKPSEVSNWIKLYGDSIDYVLIDPSGGRGEVFDHEKFIGLYEDLRETGSNLAIGFAGGFTGENVASRLSKIIEKVGGKDFCIDAEGGLRDKLGPGFGNDLLNTRKVRDYIKLASTVL